MRIGALTQIVFATLIVSVSIAQAQVTAPTDPAHPGSKIYDHQFDRHDFRCANRDITVYIPLASKPGETFPVVIYGHGQALGLDNYEGTFEHLAKKGVGVVFPTYDTGFFDQSWQRMGADFVYLSDCALAKFLQLDSTKVIYAGHSKGAYVASIASGLARSLKSLAAPKAVLLFESAGLDTSSLDQLDPAVSMTVIFSDRDTIVSRDISQQLYEKSPSLHKQMITVRSYPNGPTADHLWPLTKASMFGGTSENALHYYGAWKWLTAAAFDLSAGARFDNDYLYGTKAADKGLPGLIDKVDRNYP